MDDAARRELLDLFGDRVALDRPERHLYDHDHLPVPENVRDKIDHVPDAVVKPVSTDEVVRLVEFCRFHDVPLTPRGGASERYGAATPTQGGIVVDMTAMDEVVEVGKETARVQAGATFKELDAALAAEDVMPKVRSMGPASATVGGFAAHGGTGVGSLQFGPFANTVQALEVVTPEGDVREVDGDDLDLYLGTYGACGVITELTVEVQKRREIQPILVAFDSLQSLTECLNEHQLYTVPIWSVHIKSPHHAELRQEATGESWLPDDRWTALFLFRSNEWNGTFETEVHREYVVQDVFREVIEAYDGEQLGEDVAKREHDSLHADFAYAKLGPGFVATDGDVPLSKVHTFIDRAFDRMPGDQVAVTGHIVGEGSVRPQDQKDRIVCVTAHMADDISRPDYDLASGAQFGILDAAESVGGGPHATGLIFSHAVEQHLGPGRYRRIRRYKDAVDPNRLFNPGKITPVKVPGPAGIPVKLTTLNKIGEPLAAISAPFIGYEGPDEEFISERAIAEVLRTQTDTSQEMAEVSWDLDACTQCGYCIDECEVLDPVGWESSGTRGKLYLLREHGRGHVDLGRRQVDRLYQCTECGYCDEICPVDLTPTRIYREVKEELAERAPDGYEEIRDHVLEHGNPFGEPADKRGDWTPDEGPDQGEMVLHAGCAAAYRRSEVAQRAVGTLRQLGFDPVLLGAEEVCAGGPLVTAGFEDAFDKHAQNVIGQIQATGAKTLVCLGAEEAKTFAGDYPEVAERHGLEWDVEVKTLDQVLVECAGRGQLEALPAEEDDDEEEEEEPSSARARARGRRGGDDEGTKVLTYSPPQLTRVLGIDNGATKIVDQAEGLNAVEADLRFGVGIGGNVPEWYPELSEQRAREFFDREGGRADRLVVGDIEAYHQLARMAEKLGVEVEVQHLVEVVLDRFELSELSDEEEGEEDEEEGEIDLSHLPPKERAIKKAQIIAERKRKEG